MKYAMYILYALLVTAITQFSSISRADDSAEFAAELLALESNNKTVSEQNTSDNTARKSFQFVAGAKDSVAVFPKSILEEEIIGAGSQRPTLNELQVKEKDQVIQGPRIADRRESGNYENILPEFRVKLKSVGRKMNKL